MDNKTLYSFNFTDFFVIDPVSGPQVLSEKDVIKSFLFNFCFNVFVLRVSILINNIKS
jgi:hypothetical protein